MENYSIHFEQGYDETKKNIIEDYWQIENEEFVNKPAFLGEKYKLDRFAITKIVRTYSYCLMIKHCDSCNGFFEVKVRSQNHFPGCENICLICEERLEMERVKRKKENNTKEIIHPPISKSKTVNKFQDDTQPIEKMSLTLIKKNRAINSGDLVFQNTIRFTHDIVFNPFCSSKDPKQANLTYF
jgi:hypothetical protein